MLKEVIHFFLTTSLQKLRSCQAPFFENLVGDSTPQQKGGSAHYISRSFDILSQVPLDILSLMKNNDTFDGLRRVCKQKTEMYTI